MKVNRGRKSNDGVLRGGLLRKKWLEEVWGDGSAVKNPGWAALPKQSYLTPAPTGQLTTI